MHDAVLCCRSSRPDQAVPWLGWHVTSRVEVESGGGGSRVSRDRRPRPTKGQRLPRSRLVTHTVASTGSYTVGQALGRSRLSVSASRSSLLETGIWLFLYLSIPPSYSIGDQLSVSSIKPGWSACKCGMSTREYGPDAALLTPTRGGHFPDCSPSFRLLRPSPLPLSRAALSTSPNDTLEMSPRCLSILQPLSCFPVMQPLIYSSICSFQQAAGADRPAGIIADLADLCSTLPQCPALGLSTTQQR